MAEQRSPAARLVLPFERRRHRRSRWVVFSPFVVAVVVVASVLVWGWETRTSASPPPGTAPVTGPSPNPQNDRLLSLAGSVAATANTTGWVVLASSGELCRQCPFVIPAIEAFAPPIAGLTVYLNLSNTGPNYANVSGFSLTTTAPTSGSPLRLYYVVCCAPYYDEDTESLWLAPGQTVSLEALVAAPTLSGPAEVDYALELALTVSSE